MAIFSLVQTVQAGNETNVTLDKANEALQEINEVVQEKMDFILEHNAESGFTATLQNGGGDTLFSKEYPNPTLEFETMGERVKQGRTFLDKRDPFAITRKIKQAIDSRSEQMFQPTTNKSINLPPMHLRGLITNDQKKLVALLEIGGTIHIVRNGDTIGLHDLGIDSVIRVKQINRLNILVEVGTLGQLTIVR